MSETSAPTLPLHSWGDTMSTAETNRFCLKLATSLVIRIQHTQTRLTLDALIRGEDYEGLCRFEPDYEQLAEVPTDALYARQICAFWQKREDLDLGVDREEVAYKAFLASENSCFETNVFFRELARGNIQTSPRVAAWLFYAQQKIASILGDVPKWDEVKFRYGPGSTTSVKKSRANARYKLGAKRACSANLSQIVARLLEEMPGLVCFTDDAPTALVPVEIHHGKLWFVPKNYKTARSVVIEPELNTMFQSGIGKVMQDRLLVAGVDITDQAKNQNLARLGSIHGELATLDLSSASDTISKELVYSLLPLDWALLLDAGRTPFVTWGDCTFELEKFSSMGNGFTFPLETLIFYALALAVCLPSERRQVSVYGDDIIVPSARAEDLSTLLQVCGFKLNRQKSFSRGPFRESCGADYLSGINIRPIYLRAQLSGESLFVLHNGLRRNGLDFAAEELISWANPTWLLWGPDGYGDGHLICDQPSLTPHRRQDGYAGYTFSTYVWSPRTSKTPSAGDALLPAYSVYASHEYHGSANVSAGKQERLNLTQLRQLANSLRDISPPSTFTYNKAGKLKVRVPGTKGFRKMKIYTFQS